MKPPALAWLRLRWPRELDPSQLVAVSNLLARTASVPVAVEAVGSSGSVEHRLGVQPQRVESLSEHLRAALPGLAIEEDKARTPIVSHLTLTIRLTTQARPLTANDVPLASRALLTALASANRDELLVLQWLLIDVAPPTLVSRRGVEAGRSWSSVFLEALSGSSGELDAETRQAQRSKRGLPVWRAVGRIAVRASTRPRRRQLAGHVVDALRLVEGPGVHFRFRRVSASSINSFSRPWWPRLRINPVELAAVAAWPSDSAAHESIAQAGSRTLPVSRAVASRGRVVGQATFPGRERPVALSVSDSLRHLHVLGPTGTGKSTLLLRLIEQDMRAGRSVIVVEPKGDLIRAVIQRIPQERLDDVVLLDPTDQVVVGINPLASAGPSRELVADQLLSVFVQLYPGWAPRTNDLLGTALATLTRTPGSTLVHLPLLLGNAAFRRQVVGRLNEPIVLEPAWAQFEAWSEAERTAAIAPSLTRVRPFLARSNLRAVLGQAEPRFDLRQVFHKRTILLVNLAKGQMGSEAAALLGSLLVVQLWQTAMERSRVPADQRHPVFLFIDEFQDYLNLPTDLGDALTQARGLGVGLTLAHQHLSQLRAPIRSAVLANARSRICFQLALEDARAIAGTGGGLKAEDFMQLGAFEAYAQLLADDTVTPWATLRTLPASPPSTDEEIVRARSRERYGVDRDAVDAALRDLSLGAAEASAEDIGDRRRTGGGS